nr:small nuclear ribonucleoprotein-associated protein B'-like [Peromyscus maniculatus bairdii]
MSPGWVPLAHAKGRQETGQAVQSVAVSPHVRVRMTPRGQGSIAAAPPGRSLSVDGGDPGPGRRLRGEGLGPESTSGLSPPPGFRTTGVGVPRPRPPPHTHPGACSPEATSGPRPRPRSRDRRRGLPAAARFGSASPPPPRRRAAS